MKIWSYNPDALERCLYFVRFVKSEEGLMAAANEVFTALWPVVQPREVALAIAARPHDSSFIRYEIQVPVREWSLRGAYIPAHIAITSWEEDFKPNKPDEERILQLTRKPWQTGSHGLTQNSFQKDMSLCWTD